MARLSIVVVAFYTPMWRRCLPVALYLVCSVFLILAILLQVCRVFHLVLICIKWMNAGLSSHLYHLLCWNIRYFAHFHCVVLLLLSIEGCLHIQDTSPLSNVWCANIFSPSMTCHFIFSAMFLKEQSFNSDPVYFITLFSYGCVFSVAS
jgi:hypothetical protein